MSTLNVRNARLVLEDEVLHGSASIVDGRIRSIDEGRSTIGEDLEGDWLLPGFVELHTDHLETHYRPRPSVRWPMAAAVHAHDAQVAASGITTVLDCLRVGRDVDDGFEAGEMRALADTLADLGRAGLLRADHRLHLRCEVSAANVLEDLAAFASDADVALVSLMDHTPGERQFASLEQAAVYYRDSRGFSEAEFAAFAASRRERSSAFAQRHRDTIAARCRDSGTLLASHDDATEAHVDEAIGHDAGIAEFPTTLAAAVHAQARGLRVLMGAPNVVRARSHSGNVSARELASRGLLDILSSDYVPFSLMQAVFALDDAIDAMTLPAAVRTVSATPAVAIGLDDRGRITPGLVADLVRVHRPKAGATPVVRAVWRAGRRIA